MATWGDTIARGYAAGRAIGNDFSTARFARGAQAVKEEFQQRAAQEGRNLEDYLPEIEQRLQDLQASSGATRRGVTGLDTDYAAWLREEVGRTGHRRAGALAMCGDVAGSRDSLARTSYAMGDFDTGIAQQQGGDTIRATQGAMREDGSYDMAKGAQALAGVGARYGDSGQANAQQQGATSFRLQEAVTKADSLFRMAGNLASFSPDQIAGAWEGLRENVPELQNIDVRKDPETDTLVIYTGGKATGSIDPRNQQDMSELASMLSQFSSQPGATLQTYMGARLKSIEEAKAADTATATRFSEARIKVVEGLTSKGVPPSVAERVTSAQQRIQSGTNGWQLQDIGSEPGTYLMQKNGQVYTIKTNVAPDLATGEVGGDVQVFDAEGNPVSANVLNRQDQTAISSALVDLSAEIAATNYKFQTGILRDQLQILNELESQERGMPRAGGGGSRADRNNNPGNIKDVGQFRGQPGYIGTDSGGFAMFDNAEAGGKAMENQLQRYMRGQGVAGRPRTTVNDIVNLWSPQSDPGNAPGSTRNYADYVARKLGVNPTDQLDESQIPAMAQAMYEFESGNTSGSAPGARPATQRGAFASVQGGASVKSAPRSPVSRRAPGATQAEVTSLTERKAQADSALQDIRARMEKFDADFGVAAGRRGAMTFARSDRAVLQGFNQANLTPDQRAVREALVRELEIAKMEARSLDDQLRSSTGALAQTRDRDATIARRGELYSRYGGSADFFAQDQ